jgi:hypothetical protein
MDWRVKSIGQRSIVLTRKESHDTAFKLHNIEPIPLDESWLLRFGFDKQHAVTFSFGYEKEYSIYRKCNFTYNVIQAAWWFNGSILNNQPQYVHTLQNLIFALTGEELELKYISCNTCTNYYNPKTISKCPVCNPLIVKNDSEPPMMGMSY